MLNKEQELSNIRQNFAQIPQKRSNLELYQNISQYQIFDKSKISKEELDDYLEFCQDLFPDHEEESGILLSQKLNKMKALKYLHEADYDVIKAKFKLKYPIIFRYANHNNVNLLLNYQEMSQFLNVQNQNNYEQFDSQESDIFYQIKQIIQGKQKVSEKVFEELITMAKNKRMDLPPAVYNLQKDINTLNLVMQRELNQNVPNIKTMRDILQSVSERPVIPEKYESLKEKFIQIEQVLFKIENFEAVKEVNLQKAFDLLEQIQQLGIRLNIENSKQQYFLQFINKAKKNVDLIDTILREEQLDTKIKMDQLCQVMKFYTMHNIEQNSKLADLLAYLEKNDRIKENCLMWAEDEKNMSQFQMINELSKSNIDYQNDLIYVYKKINAIVKFNDIYNNINNEQELFENLRRIENYKQKNYPWCRKQIEYMEKICLGLKQVDDKIEEINKLNCTMEEFLFSNQNCLMNYDVLMHTVNNQYLINNQSGYYLKIKEFIKDFQIFLQKCLENDCNNKDYFQKINKLLQYSICKQNEMLLIKNELLIRIKFDCQIYTFFLTVFKKEYDFYFKSFYRFFQDSLQEIVNIEQFCKFLNDNYKLVSKSVFSDQIEIFLQKTGYIDLKNKIFQNDYNQKNHNQQIIQNNHITQYIPENVDNFNNITNNDINQIIQAENTQDNNFCESFVIRQNQNQESQNQNQTQTEIQNNNSSLISEQQNNVIKTEIKFQDENCDEISNFENWIANLKAFKTYDENIRNQYPLIQNLENQVFILKDDFEQSKKFYQEQFVNIKQLYEKSQKIKVEIYQEQIDQFQKFVIHTPKQLNAVQNYNKFLDIFKIYKKYSDIYEEYKNYIIKDQYIFPLKLPIFCIIYYKLKIIGIYPNFLKNIEFFVQQNNIIESFNLQQSKSTIDQYIYIFNKSRNFQIYNTQYEFQKGLIKLYLMFEKIIYRINKKYRNFNFFKSEINWQENDTQNYDIQLIQNNIKLFRKNFNETQIQNDITLQNIHTNQSEFYHKKINKIKLHNVHKIESQNKTKCFCGQICLEDDQQLINLSPCKTKCHKFCLKIIIKNQEKRLPCPACRYLEFAQDTEIQNLLTMKITQSSFISIYKVYAVLSQFIQNINFDYVQIIFNQLENLVQKIKNFQNLKEQNKDNFIHDIALAYILLPVRVLLIENKIFSFLS